MVKSRYFGSLQANDTAVSPVVGTILMVAVTVALGSTVLAIMNGFGSADVKESTGGVFKALAVDTGSNGKTDAIKVTFIEGPSDVNDADVSILVANAAGVQVTNQSTAAWNPGDLRIFDPPAGAEAYFVTVSLFGGTVVDQTIRVDE